MSKQLSMTTRFLRPAALAVCFATLLHMLAGLPVGAQEGGFADALGLMKREQTLGEANAGLLKTFARDDTATLARGILLYAEAQAEFNALIETLKAELNTEGALSDSEGFTDVLQNAADRRVIFTDFVEKKVLSRIEDGTKSLATALGGGDVLENAAELITALKDAGLDIWREYRAADKEQQQQILDQLDTLKWRSFGDVPELG